MSRPFLTKVAFHALAVQREVLADDAQEWDGVSERWAYALVPMRQRLSEIRGIYRGRIDAALGRKQASSRSSISRGFQVLSRTEMSLSMMANQIIFAAIGDMRASSLAP